MAKKKGKKKKSLPRNFVAKNLPHQHKSVPFRDKTKYSRKDSKEVSHEFATAD